MATSYTPGCSTPPDTVTSIVPGASADPAARNDTGPYRADEGHVRERLGIVHESRHFGRSTGACSCRAASSARSGPTVQPRDQCRLLARARTVPVGAAPRPPPAPGPCPARSATARSTAATTSGRSAADTHDDPSGPKRTRSHRGAVEHEMRNARQQHLVLGAGRLALHGVDHEGPLASRRSDEPELGGRRERGAPSTRQPRRLDHRREPFGPRRIAGPRQWRRAVMGQVGREIGAAARPPAPEQRRPIGGHDAGAGCAVVTGLDLARGAAHRIVACSVVGLGGKGLGGMGPGRWV